MVTRVEIATRQPCGTGRAGTLVWQMSFPNAPEPSESEPGLEKRLQSLEQQAEMALPGFDAQFFTRAGDLCVDAREDRRAVTRRCRPAPRSWPARSSA